jgi:hypothetical protein
LASLTPLKQRSFAKPRYAARAGAAVLRRLRRIARIGDRGRRLALDVKAVQRVAATRSEHGERGADQQHLHDRVEQRVVRRRRTDLGIAGRRGRRRIAFRLPTPASSPRRSRRMRLSVREFPRRGAKSGDPQSWCDGNERLAASYPEGYGTFIDTHECRRYKGMRNDDEKIGSAAHPDVVRARASGVLHCRERDDSRSSRRISSSDMRSASCIAGRTERSATRCAGTARPLSFRRSSGWSRERSGCRATNGACSACSRPRAGASRGGAWSASNVLEEAVHDFVVASIDDWQEFETVFPGVRAASEWPARDLEKDGI